MLALRVFWESLASHPRGLKMVTTETTRKNQAILPLQKRGEDKAEASSLSEVAFEMEWQCADEERFEPGEGGDFWFLLLECI